MLRKNILLFITIALFFTGAITVQATDIPTLPALCYGELKINGNPAPSGTLVVAKVDNVERGSFVSTREGWYGGPGGLESKMTVSGSGLTGKMVKFYLSGVYGDKTFNNVYAGEELYWGSGEVKQINLAVNITVDTPGPQPDPGPGNGTDPGTPPDSDPVQAPQPDPGPGNGTDPGTPPESGPVQAPQPDPVTGVVFGDMNDDNLINILDVNLAIQQVLGIKELTAEQKEAADVNKDGIVDILDVVLIMRYVLGLIDTFN